MVFFISQVMFSVYALFCSAGEFKVYKRRWAVLAIFTLYSSSNALQWIQYSIIANIIQKWVFCQFFFFLVQTITDRYIYMFKCWVAIIALSVCATLGVIEHDVGWIFRHDYIVIACL